MLLLAASYAQSLAQGGTWTWIKGADTGSSKGNYGIKGIASPSNEPPARYEACYWMDKQGNFWVFGGTHVGGIIGRDGNDLWKYDVGTNMWTWVNGPNVITAPQPNGVPGTKGIPSVNNFPPAHGFGVNCWTDNNGDFWLYSGDPRVTDDLWRYHVATNEWTWMAGSLSGVSSVPVFGAKGVPAAGNTPGALEEVKSAWVDGSNNLWMFGGQSAGGRNNVLSKYDVSTGMWSWISGSTIPVQPGSYGTMGVETATNEPPARWSYTRWKDRRGHFYIFGGAIDCPGLGGLAGGLGTDVWRYRPSANRWTWVSGANIGNDLGNYPVQKCVFSNSHYPRSRKENHTPALIGDNCSRAFWMFGGFTLGDSTMNDLWLFETDSMRWAWISGVTTRNPNGNYGIKGIPSTSNMPPGKGGMSSWIDRNNNLWIFGGITSFPDSLRSSNDLWRFTPDSTCVNIRLLFGGQRPVPPDTSLCLGDTSSMYIGTHTSVAYSPAAGVTPNSDTSRLLFRPITTTTYQVIVSGGSCLPEDTSNFTIHVAPRDTVNLSAPTPLALCRNDTATMFVNPAWTISVSSNIGVSYQTTGGTMIKFFPTALSTQYMVIARGSQPCTYPDTVRFTITRDTVTQHIPLMTDTMLCKGDSAIYTLNQKVDTWSVSPGGGFSVNKDTTVFRFFPEYATSYRFVGIKNKGCRPKDTIYFSIHRSQLKAGFVLTPKLTSINAARFTLNNTSTGASKYQWYVNGSAFSTQTSPSYTATDSGRYCFLLLATDILNCADTAQDCADVVGQVGVYLPSAFSPNGDGVNDILFVRGRGIQTINVAIFNRWGQRVFESNDVSKGWDGRYNGREQEIDVYSYVLKATFVDGSSISKTGNVSIIK